MLRINKISLECNQASITCAPMHLYALQMIMNYCQMRLAMVRMRPYYGQMWLRSDKVSLNSLPMKWICDRLDWQIDPISLENTQARIGRSRVRFTLSQIFTSLSQMKIMDVQERTCHSQLRSDPAQQNVDSASLSGRPFQPSLPCDQPGFGCYQLNFLYKHMPCNGYQMITLKIVIQVVMELGLIQHILINYLKIFAL